jgi:membrane protease subunit (stomatin/prohibitin family)
MSNFKSVTKKDVKVYLNKKLSSDQVTLSPVNTPPNFYFGEIKRIGDTYYCIYYTDQTMKAKFHEEISKKESDYLVEYTKKRFDADKVVFNPRMNAIILLHRIKDVAIADKENNYIWTFSPNISDRTVKEQLGL